MFTSNIFIIFFYIWIQRVSKYRCSPAISSLFFYIWIQRVPKYRYSPAISSLFFYIWIQQRVPKYRCSPAMSSLFFYIWIQRVPKYRCSPFSLFAPENFSNLHRNISGRSFSSSTRPQAPLRPSKYTISIYLYYVYIRICINEKFCVHPNIGVGTLGSSNSSQSLLNLNIYFHYI